MASRNGGQAIDKFKLEKEIAELFSFLRVNVKNGTSKLALHHAREIATRGFRILEWNETLAMIEKSAALAKIESAPWTFTDEERRIFELAFRMGYAKRFREEREARD